MQPGQLHDARHQALAWAVCTEAAVSPPALLSVWDRIVTAAARRRASRRTPSVNTAAAKLQVNPKATGRADILGGVA